MVSLSCQMVVRYELEKLVLNLYVLEPGKVEVLEAVSTDQIQKFKQALIRSGLEITENRKEIITERIIHVITEMINDAGNDLKTKLSYYLSMKLNLDYTYLANVFSEVKGTTIEHFVIMSKIEKAKQLICHKELNMTEISWRLRYSSVAHLSTQFKKITGLTPSQFKHVECNSPLRPETCEL